MAHALNGLLSSQAGLADDAAELRVACEDLTSGFRVLNKSAIRLLASAEASQLDFQDVGVLLILERAGCRIAEHPVTMHRAPTVSKNFSLLGSGDGICCKRCCWAQPKAKD